MRYLLTGIFLTISSYNLFGQDFNSFRQKRVNTSQMIVVLDSNTVVPSTIQVSPFVPFRFNPQTNAVIFEKGNSGEVSITYRVIPYQLNAELKKREEQELLDSNQLMEPIPDESIETNEELFYSPGIEKSGVLSRGISFGNRQDVFVNSNLNLQMRGELRDGIYLNASISDQNVPFQPEGNTQQIQEFDQIFIDLSHQLWSLRAGDLLIQKRDNYFMQYNKKTQGAFFELKPKTDSVGARTYGSASLAKGKFNSMLLSPIEGIQGPYRLEGQNGEQFIIVVANSERVFLDGKRLERGFDYDYIIDYNTAEIIFNNQIVINKFSRIRVDFEYTERNYSRSVYAFGHHYKNKKLNLGFDFFNEQDNKRQPLLGPLSDQEIKQLSLIGDSLNQAFVSGVDSISVDDVNQVLYERVDTLGDTIYRYSTNTNIQLYNVTFTQVTVGDYVKIDSMTINGRVFRWVGKGQGNYLPIKVIPAPNKRQMMALKGEINLGKRSSIFGEIALSNKDQNLFSKLGDDDNYGVAFQIGHKTKKKRINKKVSMSSSVDMQFQAEQFNSLDRIRHVDFERNWSADQSLKREEKMLTGSLFFQDTLSNQLRLGVQYRNKKGDINGFQQTVNYQYVSGKYFGLKVQSFVMENKTEERHSQWRRYTVNPAIKIKSMEAGYEFNMEKNREYDIALDSFLRPAMNYDENVVYLRTRDSSSGGFSLSHRFRKDYLPVNNSFDWFMKEWHDNANTSTAEYTGKVGEHNDFRLSASYRTLVTKDTSATLPREENILGRFDWTLRALKRSITSDLVYNINSARELVREVQYIGVLPSQGTHVWIDYNGDGIKDLDEFQEVVQGVAINADTLYAKFLIPTTEYRPAFTHKFNYRVNMRAPVAWKREEGIKKFISRFDNMVYYLVEKKTQSTNINERINPFRSSVKFDSENDQVLSLRRNFRTTLFFNRTNPKYGLDATRITQGNKQLLSYGNDGRYLNEWNSNARLTIRRMFTLKSKGTLREKRSRSTSLLSRNYDIDEFKIDNSLSFQPNTVIRITGGVARSVKEGVIEDLQPIANTFEYSVETKIRQLSKRTITTSLKYVRINFEGVEPNSPIGYDMLDALLPGNNILWNMNIQQRMTNGLNLTLLYEGRKSEDNPVIHTGSVQVSALF